MNCMPRNTTEWSIDASAAFADMWRDGMPAKEIADRLNVTVGAVNKKRWRLGLDPRGSNVGSIARWEKEREAKPYKPKGFTVTPRSPTPYRPKQLQHPQHMAPVALLKRTGCAFPVDRVNDEWAFCNCAPAEASPYCRTHQSQMYETRYRR